MGPIDRKRWPQKVEHNHGGKEPTERFEVPIKADSVR